MTAALAPFVHVLNPNRRNRKRVRRFFSKHPELAHYWVERDTHPTHLETMIHWAVVEGRRHIAVWGGDGTFSRAVNALVEQKALPATTLLLVPCGTGNDFARKIGLARLAAVAKGKALEAGVLRFDVGLLLAGGDRRVFVNNAGFGRTSEGVARKRPSAIRDVLSFRPRRLTLEWEAAGSRAYERIEALMGIVFNGPYFNRGLHFDATIAPDDGMLSAFFEPERSRCALLTKFAAGRIFKRPLASSDSFRVDASAMRVESDEPLYPQADGEAAASEGVKALDFSVLPGAMNLLVLR